MLALDDGTYHLWFTDFAQLKSHSVFLATSPHSARGAFTYQGVAVAQPGLIINDVKQLRGLYVAAMHDNGPSTYVSVASEPGAFPAAQQLFAHESDADAHIVSVGLVVDAASERLLARSTAPAPCRRSICADLRMAAPGRVLLVGNGSDVVLLGENASALGDAQRLRFQTRGAAPVIGCFTCRLGLVDLHERHSAR